MKNYDAVNNPFITLRKLSGDEEKSFTTNLNTSPPSVDNDKYMSNLKQSKDSFYSDTRSDHKRMDDADTISFEKYSVTLMDIDNILYEYFTKVISPQVEVSGGNVISVPVRHASPERWGAIQQDGALRDEKGQIQKPMIIFTRTSVSQDDSFVHFNRHLSVPFVKKFDKKNMYDKFSALTQSQPVMEVHNITFPDHVVLNYDFTMTTDYVQQMNTLVETINWASNDYWGDPERLKFRASVDSFSNSIEVPSDDDRVVTTTFSLTVNAYLLPDVFNNKKTTQRNLTNRKVLFGTEVISDSSNPATTPQSLREQGFQKTLIFNRKQRELFLEGDVGDEYEIRMWNDEELYTLNISGNSYKITTEIVDDEDFFVFNFETDDELFLRKGETHNITLNNKVAQLRIHESATDIFYVKYIS
jgi:hypothetical protein